MPMIPLAAVAWTAAGLSAAGTAASAYGAIQQGNYSAHVARNNAQIAKQNATYSTAAGESQSTTEGLKNASEIAQLRSDFGANNIDPNSGSALAVTKSAKAAGQLDQQQVLQNALLQAYGYNTTASNETAQASQDQTAGYEQAASGILQNASALSFKWAGLQNQQSGATTPDPGTDYARGY